MVFLDQPRSHMRGSVAFAARIRGAQDQRPAADAASRVLLLDGQRHPVPDRVTEALLRAAQREREPDRDVAGRGPGATAAAAWSAVVADTSLGPADAGACRAAQPEARSAAWSASRMLRFRIGSPCARTG